jgi:3-hydroxyisobutyrate dehydrogenase-like beta-hydroxyacid dehydrogenase
MELETATLATALGGGPLGSQWQVPKLKRTVEGDFSAQFAFSLALKDVDLALEAVGRERFRALTCLADEWLEVVDRGLGNSDLTVVARALEQKGKAITRANSAWGYSWLADAVTG